MSGLGNLVWDAKYSYLYDNLLLNFGKKKTLPKTIFVNMLFLNDIKIDIVVIIFIFYMVIFNMVLLYAIMTGAGIPILLPTSFSVFQNDVGSCRQIY